MRYFKHEIPESEIVGYSVMFVSKQEDRSLSSVTISYFFHLYLRHYTIRISSDDVYVHDMLTADQKTKGQDILRAFELEYGQLTEYLDIRFAAQNLPGFGATPYPLHAALSEANKKIINARNPRLRYMLGWHDLTAMEYNPEGYMKSWQDSVREADNAGMDVIVFRVPKAHRLETITEIEVKLQQQYGA